MAHRTAAIPMTLSDLQDRSHTACLYIVIFRTSVKRLTRFEPDVVRRAVPPR